MIWLRSVSIWIQTDNFMLTYKVKNFYLLCLVIMAFSKDTLHGQLNTVGWTFGWRLSLIIKCRWVIDVCPILWWFQLFLVFWNYLTGPKEYWHFNFIKFCRLICVILLTQNGCMGFIHFFYVWVVYFFYFGYSYGCEWTEESSFFAPCTCKHFNCVQLLITK